MAATTKPPMWFWILASLALLWMLFGVLALMMDWMADDAAVAQMSAAQQKLRAERPLWIFGVYSVAIFSGLAGVIGLLLRQRWAVALLALSLFAVIVQFGYILLLMDTVALLGFASAVSFPIVISVFGVLVLWLAVVSRRRGWLN